MQDTTTASEEALIDPDVIARVLGAALEKGGDFAEVFAEDRYATGAVLDDGRVEELSSARDRGAGIRVVVGETTGFAHTAELTEAGLIAAARAAAAVARDSGPTRVGTSRRWNLGARAPGERRREEPQDRAFGACRRGSPVYGRIGPPGVGLLRRQQASRPHRDE